MSNLVHNHTRTQNQSQKKQRSTNSQTRRENPRRSNRSLLIGLLGSAILFGGTTTGALAAKPQASESPSEATAGSQASGPIVALTIAVDKLVQDQMTQCGMPGYAVAIIRDGNLVLGKGYGFANVPNQTPVTPRTVFGLASVTKTFTALTLLSLVDKKMLSLSDTLDQYIPNLPRPYQKLTIRQLASMTAGVPKIVEPEVEWVDQLPSLIAKPLVSKPGSQFLYSNYSYRLLGSVIEKVTGKKYFEVVNQTVLQPCGMQSTGTTLSLAATGRVTSAYGPTPNGGMRPIEYKSPKISFAAGMLATDLEDMIAYAQALLARKILSPAGYQTLWLDRPPLTGGQPSPWAFGWASTNNGSTLKVSMNGSTPGVASSIILLPDKNCAVVALCNLRRKGVHGVANKVANLAFMQPAPEGGEPEVENAGE